MSSTIQETTATTFGHRERGRSSSSPGAGGTVPAGAADQPGGEAVGSSSHEGDDGSHSLDAAGSSSAGQMKERSLGSQVPVFSSNGQAGAGGSCDPRSSYGSGARWVFSPSASR